MAWIKQHYDRFLLAVFALVLLISAGLLIANARGYSEVFSPLQKQVVPTSKVPVSVDTDAFDKKMQKLAGPDVWKPRQVGKYQLPLFVSEPYVAKDENGNKVKVAILEENSLPLHPPIDNQWFLDHNLDLLASNALDQDPDGDGFSNLDEWTAKTDPSNKDSHPPYWTKLYLKRFVRVPFHLRFESKNADKFFINNTADEEAPTQVKKLGETVVLGKYRFKLLNYREKYDTSQGFKKDLSELTLVNVDTNQQVVLPKGEDVDSPTTYAVLDYVWTGLKEFAVQRDGEFTLAPENNVKYKVVELTDTDVRVLKTDENKEIHLRPQAAR